jgi:hypothetical protein
MAFQIVFSEWLNTARLHTHSMHRPWLFPRFRVSEEGENLFFVNVEVPDNTLVLKYKNSEEAFKNALLRYSVQRIENALRNNGFLSNQPNRLEEISIRDDDLLLIDKLIQGKRCGYQINEGRNLFCSANDPDDYKGTNLAPKRVPVSRPICLNCDLPDADYLCSHLIHPAVMSQGGMGAPFGRFTARALCNLGLEGAEKGPSRCHAGGHPCWERIIEPEIEASEIPLSSLALPEAFDYLDAVWRNAMGPNHALFRLTTVSGMAQLAQPCTTLDEFESRLSALSAVFKAMTIQDDLLEAGSQGLKKDQTFDRLLACQKLKDLEEADYQAVERGVKILRTVNRVRNVQQHADNREFLRTLVELGIPYPPPNWGDAWDRVRDKTMEALTTIREKIRML